jgi:hypothetical protein
MEWNWRLEKELHLCSPTNHIVSRLTARAVFFPDDYRIKPPFFFRFSFFLFFFTQDHQLKSTPVFRLLSCSGVSDVCVEINNRI